MDNKIMLVKNKERKIYKLVKSKLNVKNVAVLYFISQLFNCSIVSKDLLEFIERFFQTFVDSTSFLELDFKLVSKVVSCNELNIDSEMEVFNAVISWLGHNKERNIYAKDLFLKVRLCFFSEPALKLITEKMSCFINDFACINQSITVKENISLKKHENC